jgi:4-amino-4-deoxy-L-arabinose transferase-like glycosyltransferase
MKVNEAAIVFLAVIAIGLITAFYLYYMVDKYSLIYYWDSISHMVAARKFVDWSENPGLGQIGTVWMPLPHFLLLPFTLIDALFTAGSAGTALSLPCLAITSVFIYKIVKAQSKLHVGAVVSYAAIAGALLYATNPNILYLGITAMTEAPFMLFFVASAYYFQKWFQHGNSLKDLLLCSIFLSFATLCRYEGWFLPVFVVIATSIFIFKSKEKNQNQKVLAILISIVSLTSIVFWLAWNQYHYGDPFEFSNIEYYSASWYAENRPFRELLFLQPANVMSIYGIVAFTIYGPILIGAGAVGYFLIYRKNCVSGKNIVLLFLALPSIFTIISLLIGVGEMSYWFNSRFMVLLSPLVIVMACILLAKLTAMTKNQKVLATAIGVLFVWQLLTPAFIVPTYSDAIGGHSVKENLLAAETGEALKSLYDDNGNIMILTGSGLEHRVMVTSGIALRNFDEIIEHSTWKASFKEPWSYDRWMVITNKPGTDALSTTQYWLDRMDELETHYNIVYDNEYYKIMVLK